MLSDCAFLNSYSSGINEPKDFFTEALIESKQFDLGLGFFSSSGLRSLAYGMAVFIANGGKMRILINHILSESDKKAIQNGQNGFVEGFEARMLSKIDELVKVLSKEDEHFYKCLSYLISINRIEFAATVSTKGGMGHDKYGVFTDDSGNKVAFIGSANFSKTALELNGETITVFSEAKDFQRIDEYQSLFDETWGKDTPHLIHIPIRNVKTHIAGRFSAVTLQELLQEGVDISKLDIESVEPKSHKSQPLPARLLEKIETKEQEPRFPFPEERQIQKDAYAAWINNDKKGIFAMATGSGKTVTALNCLLKQYKENGFYKAIIVVPTQALVKQWEKEAKSFNFQNIVSTHTEGNWRDILARYISRSMISPKKNLILITTYATFNRTDIQTFLRKVKGINTFVYIADEAHNLGATSSLKNLPVMIDWRIGLSATPERVYDEGGSKKIYEFFSSTPPKYTYRFTMKQAIYDEPSVLCHYDYYPIFVDLTDEEMEEYLRVTKLLRRFIDPLTGKYTEEAETLLLKRKRIIHKAANKKKVLSELLDNLKKAGKLDYTFVFVPEGYEPNYSETSSYDIQSEDMHLINEYGDMFKEHGYSYHKYISGVDDAQGVLDSFARGDIQVLLSMKCLDEGVDIPRAEHAIFCSSTGNPRQFVQRRGRVLRKCKGKEKAVIWDLVVTPPNYVGEGEAAERNLFTGEVKRIVNFAALADNQVKILYGKLKEICESLNVNLFDILDEENRQYE